MENDLGAEKRTGLKDLLDLPTSYGGAGLQSVISAADEEFLGSFAGIATPLISFCTSTELPAYIRISKALQGTENGVVDTGCATVKGVKEASERTGWMREPLSEEESSTATELVKGSRVVEAPGAYDPDKQNLVLEPVTLLEPRLLGDYIIAPCKHECGIIKQIRHAKQAHRLLSTLNPTKQSLLRATAGLCGMDSAHGHSSTIREVVSLDRPGGLDWGSREALLFYVPRLCIAMDCQWTMQA